MHTAETAQFNKNGKVLLKISTIMTIKPPKIPEIVLIAIIPLQIADFWMNIH